MNDNRLGKIEEMCNCDEKDRTIRLISEKRDVTEVVARFEELIKNFNVTFKSAEIMQKGFPMIYTDKSQMEFYPLRLHGDGGIEVLVSEVRCGYHGESPMALIEVLKLAGFNVTQYVKDTIYNETCLFVRVSKDGNITRL